MGKASREKGKRGEREVAQILRAHGYKDAHRGAQYTGNAIDGQDDVTGLPGWHIEVKRTEALSIYQAYEQARRDIEARQQAEPDRAVVIHRRSGKPWLAIVSLDDFLALLDSARDTVTEREDRL